MASCLYIIKLKSSFLAQAHCSSLFPTVPPCSSLFLACPGPGSDSSLPFLCSLLCLLFITRLDGGGQSGPVSCQSVAVSVSDQDGQTLHCSQLLESNCNLNLTMFIRQHLKSYKVRFLEIGPL